MDKAQRHKAILTLRVRPFTRPLACLRAGVQSQALPPASSWGGLALQACCGQTCL